MLGVAADGKPLGVETLTAWKRMVIEQVCLLMLFIACTTSIYIYHLNIITNNATMTATVETYNGASSDHVLALLMYLT
jgi:hypothetical protein